MNIVMAIRFAMTPMLITITAGSILNNNRVGLRSTVVDFVVVAIGKDVTISMNISMTKSFAIMAIDMIMTIGRGSILGDNWVGLGTAVVYFIVMSITKDIIISMNISMTKSFSAITKDMIMTIGRGSILDNNRVGLGSTVVHLVVVAISKDIAVFVETMTIS